MTTRQRQSTQKSSHPHWRALVWLPFAAAFVSAGLADESPIGDLPPISPAIAVMSAGEVATAQPAEDTNAGVPAVTLTEEAAPAELSDAQQTDGTGQPTAEPAEDTSAGVPAVTLTEEAAPNELSEVQQTDGTGKATAEPEVATDIPEESGLAAADPVDEPGPGDTGASDDTVTAETPPESKPDLPVAENVDLSEPVAEPDTTNTPAISSETATADSSEAPPRQDDEIEREAKPALILLGSEVAAGTSTRLSWSPQQNFAGIDTPTPVLVVNGVNDGPVLCLTAAVHGDELNGIEIVRRVLYDLEPKKLSGTVIGVPIVNLQGFRRGSRYLPDRRDLNRFFPGNPDGSAAARIAYSFFTEVVTHCDALVDIHTGSFHRTNLPQLRADVSDPAIVRLTQGFGATVVMQSEGTAGTLRRAAVHAGIPAVTLETGGPQRVQTKAVKHGAKGILTLLHELGMVTKKTTWGNREPVYYRSTWVRADQGGVLFSNVDLGERVTQGEALGTITDPITNVQTEVRASVDGRVLGMALNQFVMPGFAAFHLGIEKPVDELAEPVDIAQTDDPGPDEVVVPGEASQTTAPMPETDTQMEVADHIDGSE